MVAGSGSEECASLRLGTGESGAGRRMWFFRGGGACAVDCALEEDEVSETTACVFISDGAG